MRLRRKKANPNWLVSTNKADTRRIAVSAHRSVPSHSTCGADAEYINHNYAQLLTFGHQTAVSNRRIWEQLPQFIDSFDSDSRS